MSLLPGAPPLEVAPMVSKRFGAAIIMPNTKPPITTAEMATAYANEIGQAVGPEKFYPLMTLYLTDTLDPREVERAANIVGVKYYPRGLTTNSDSGVENPKSLWTKGTKPYEVLRALAERGLVLLLHAADGYAPNGLEIDPYDQERVFFEISLPNIVDAHPDLKISVEHLSTAFGVGQMMYTYGRTGRIGCSITAHHLLLDRRDVFRGGFHPHRHWWPIIQSSEHKQELRKLASQDHPFVWLGSDSAPHPVESKESDCCAGGVLMAHAGIELYAEVFEDMGALDDRFERFASINGPRFYGLPPSSETIGLVREEWKVERPLRCYKPSEEIHPLRKNWDEVIPFRLGEKIRWKLAV